MCHFPGDKHTDDSQPTCTIEPSFAIYSLFYDIYTQFWAVCQLAHSGTILINITILFGSFFFEEQVCC